MRIWVSLSTNQKGPHFEKLPFLGFMREEGLLQRSGLLQSFLKFSSYYRSLLVSPLLLGTLRHDGPITDAKQTHLRNGDPHVPPVSFQPRCLFSWIWPGIARAATLRHAPGTSLEMCFCGLSKSDTGGVSREPAH